jgi:hypothetical protein
MSSKLDPRQKDQRSRAGKTIVKMASSTSFLVITLFFTMSVIFSALSSGESFFGIYGGLLGNPAGAAALAQGEYLPLAVLILLGIAPSMMICAGLWTFCLESRKKGGGLQAGSLNFIRGAVIAQFGLIFLLIIMVLSALFVSFSFVTLEPFSWGSLVAGGKRDLGLGFTMLAAAAIAAVMAVYMRGILITLRLTIDSLRTGARRGEVPLLLVIINYGLSAVSLIGAGFDISKGYAAAAVAGIFTAAFLLGLAASLSIMRKTL